MIRKCAIRFSPIFFPEDSTFVDFELAGLLACLAFLRPSRPELEQWQRLQKHYRGLQLRVQLRYRTGFPFQMRYWLINQDTAKV